MGEIPNKILLELDMGSPLGKLLADMDYDLGVLKSKMEEIEKEIKKLKGVK